MMSRLTGGGFDINSLLVVKKSAAALTCRKSKLSLLLLDEGDGSGLVLPDFPAYSARFWINSGVSKTSAMG